MRSKRRKSYIISSGYIGAGNKFSVISARPRSAYQHIRNVYGAELQRWEDATSNGISSPDLTSADRKRLKERIRLQLKTERKRRATQLALTTVLTIALFVGGYYLIKWVVSSLF